MRKNSIRKLVHGILDLLPLFVIPIFAININQKSVEPISIEVEEYKKVDFNQLVSAFNSDSTLKSEQLTINQITENYVNFDVNSRWGFNFGWSINFYSTDTYYLKLDITIPSSSYTFALTNTRWSARQVIANYSSSGSKKLVFTPTENYNTLMTYNSYNGVIQGYEITNLQIFNLTQMGLTSNEVDNLFTNSYYERTLSEIKIVDLGTQTYNDTDIGSQFLYSLYISTDKYFNMNQVFNLNSVYSWFELNIFGGSAPLSIYIVWNIIIYELVMDLLMLLYAVFMFFIDMCQKLMDKPLNSIK